MSRGALGGASGSAGGSDSAGPLVVSVGTTVVATDGMLHYLDRLDDLVDDLAHLGARLLSSDRAVDWRAVVGAPAAATLSESRLDELREMVDRSRRTASALHATVSLALRGYRATDEIVEAAGRELGGALAATLGFALRGWAIAAAPFAFWGALSAAVGWKLAPGSDQQKVDAVRRWLIEHPRTVTSPEVAAVARNVAMHLDSVAMGATGIPPSIAGVVGSEALGALSVEENAAGIMVAGSAVGLFRESSVRVDRTATTPVASAPTGAADRLARVPEGDQVRVERYEAPGLPDRFIVYVGPTETFSPAPGHEPWDLTSNLGAVAGLPAGSIRATELAMQDAGVSHDSDVQFVGFSQGGIVAARLAASGEWNAVGLETYGAPIANIDLPEGLPGLTVRHSDDVVAGLSGDDRPSTRVVVEQEAFANGEPPTDMAAPAHQRRSYDDTAADIDQAKSAVVRDQLAQLRAFTDDVTAVDGSRITSMTYHAERG